MARRKKSNLALWIILIVVVLAGLVVWKIMAERAKDVISFSCEASKSIEATFNGGSAPTVDLVLSDGRKLNLNVTASAGGARYANSGETIVFWNTGNTARLEENGSETFSNCLEQ